MSKETSQINPSHSVFHSMGTSLKHATLALVGVRQLLNEFSAAAAHYDGLIDSIERAGWDLSKLERVGHAFDSTAQSLLSELVDSYPDMTEIEQQSFLEPFHNALHQFSHMSMKEKGAFRTEYDRFKNLRSQSEQELAFQNA